MSFKATIEDGGQTDYHWDIAWFELNADINAAKSGQGIPSQQVWYLREKYLRMKRDDGGCLILPTFQCAIKHMRELIEAKSL
ncbi:hypothetical protein [Allobaculum sp. JKK-2023]|uniref:hypothetical protein n=1 Tax=Allobaculum sp. JKK-2023 TaxID=3108943 RepID=UPI002B058BD9|nr:hypothetical protein [Allobaculum sp. JKK-2023]